MSRSWSSVGKTTGDPRIGSPVRSSWLLAEIQFLEEFAILRKVVLLEVIKELATTARHLQQPAARVEVLAVGAEMLGQVIDPGGEERDLDLGGSSVLFVGFVFGDDVRFDDCGHWFWISGWHDCRDPLRAP